MSLLYTVAGLDRRRWDPVVALIRPGEDVAALYRGAGIETVEWSGIVTVEHTTARHLRATSPLDWVHAVNTAASLRGSIRRTHELVDHVRPDLVHLNSAVLVPSAMAMRTRAEPWVWHVREAPVHGLTGVRRRAIARALERWPAELFFISEADRQAWVGGRRGVVVHNFVDLQRFNPAADAAGGRAMLGVPDHARLILFLGGIGKVKGVLELLDALAEVRRTVPDVCCVMAGAVYRQSTSRRARLARAVLPHLGTGTWSQRVEQRIDALGVRDACLRIPFTADIAPLIAAADVVVFPALVPHFPRPAMEAAAVGRPVVASRLAGVTEVVIDGQTGVLTPPGDAHALADALCRVLTDPAWAASLGAAARRHAEQHFDPQRQVRLITDVYEKVLS
jgi:glycosyltransferase involved in cell wall biosynthesis